MYDNEWSMHSHNTGRNFIYWFEVIGYWRRQILNYFRTNEVCSLSLTQGAGCCKIIIYFTDIFTIQASTRNSQQTLILQWSWSWSLMALVRFWTHESSLISSKNIWCVWSIGWSPPDVIPITFLDMSRGNLIGCVNCLYSSLVASRWAKCSIYN